MKMPEVAVRIAVLLLQVSREHGGKPMALTLSMDGFEIRIAVDGTGAVHIDDVTGRTS
jgi:hypothetical protein